MTNPKLCEKISPNAEVNAKKTGDVQNWGCSSSKIGFEPGRLEYISPTKLWFETIKTADIDLF